MALDPLGSDDWKRYPTCLPRSVGGDSDLEFHHQTLVQSATRLFSGRGDVEVWSNDGLSKGESRR